MRRYFKNRKLQKHVKHYVDPNAIRDDKDDATSYLKDIAGLATILGVGATGGALLPNGRVYAAQTSVDPKSQVVGSVSDFIKSGASDTLVASLIVRLLVLALLKIKLNQLQLLKVHNYLKVFQNL